jgi:hypothetical protein
VGAVSVPLDPSDLDRLEAIAPRGVATGDRYSWQHAYGDSPEPAESS